MSKSGFSMQSDIVILSCSSNSSNEVFAFSASKLTDLLADLDAVIDDQMPKREAKKKDLAKKQSTFLEIRDKYEEASGRREEAERILPLSADIAFPHRQSG